MHHTATGKENNNITMAEGHIFSGNIATDIKSDDKDIKWLFQCVYRNHSFSITPKTE